MTIKKPLYLRESPNKGLWLAEKIYSDVKGNRCACGGLFTTIKKFKEMRYPTCAKCGADPRLFRIRAKVAGFDHVERYIDIRHTQAGERLQDIIDVFATLKQVANEVVLGTFDLRKYDTLTNRESFLFCNYSASYLAYYERKLTRGEISPAGMKNKRKYIKVLNQFFSQKDIGAITYGLIDDFKNSFTDRFRTRDLAVGELRAILNHACRHGDINKVPKFATVPASKKRKEVISLEAIRATIPNVINDKYRFMIELLAMYPVRPCELRALKWIDVDILSGVVIFRRHFSDEVLLDGRKSAGQGEKSCVEFPLSAKFKEYLLSQPRPLSKDTFIFAGARREFVTEKCLSNAWRRATSLAGLPHHQLYELRHARLSEIAELTNGDVVKMMKVSGHTNPKTLLERYVRSNSDIGELFH